MGDLPMAPVLDSWTIPVITVSLATAYAAYRGRQRRGMLNNIYDSTRVGLFYLGCIVAAMVLTNVQPELSIFLVILLVIVLSMAVGSRLVGSVTGGLPFIGIASLGSIFLVGLLFVLGGLAVIGALIGPIIISVGTSAAVGTFIAVERHMANRGHGHDSMSTVYGLVSFLQEYQVETIIVVIIIAAATYFLFV